jgi:hypothetical protein
MEEVCMSRVPGSPGEQIARCAKAAADQVGGLLGEELLAVYLIGSGALGGPVAEQSDVDLVAICANRPQPETVRQVVAVLTREALTWPVRGLEFVLYTLDAVATPSPAPQFELNLNIGRRMPLHVSFDPREEPTHWFLVDLAILREHGVPLSGPPPARLVAPLPRAWLLAAVADSLAWHAGNEPVLHQTVLNAARSWRFAEEGVWSSKDAAAVWALARAEDPSLVETAVAVRHGDRSRALDPARVRRFVAGVQAQVDEALRVIAQALPSVPPSPSTPARSSAGSAMDGPRRSEAIV